MYYESIFIRFSKLCIHRYAYTHTHTHPYMCVCTLKKLEDWDFTGSEVQQLGIALQGGGHGFEHWSGKITRVVERESPSATNTEPML